MHTYTYKCYGDKSIRPNVWEGEIQLARSCQSTMEAEVQTRGSCFWIIIGRCKTGNFLCIPNWNIGMELASFSDCF